MRLSPIASVVLCASCSERSPSDEGRSKVQESTEEVPFTAVFHADRLGQPVSLQVLLLPEGGVLSEGPDAIVGGGATGETMTVDEGDWSAQVGESYDNTGLFDGQAFHVDDDGTYWIAPPHPFGALRGGTLEHTFELNLLAAGWWECCIYVEAAVCGMDNVDYADGRVAILPVLGEVEVTGMSFAGTRKDGDTTEGQFLGPESASATVTRPDGSSHAAECCKGRCSS